jgi:anti-sigma B factor antagonist
MTLSSPSYNSPVYSCEQRTSADGTTFLQLSGDLDLFSAPEFQRTTGMLLAGGCRRVVVDLARVEFVDSAGLAALMVLYRNCQASHCELALVDATGRQENLYALTGLDRVLPLSEAPLEALAGRGSDRLPVRDRVGTGP